MHLRNFAVKKDFEDYCISMVNDSRTEYFKCCFTKWFPQSLNYILEKKKMILKNKIITKSNLKIIWASRNMVEVSELFFKII